MSYLISELGEEILLDVERFCAERIKMEAPVYDRSGEWPAELYEEAYALGYHTLEVPEEYGGMGEIPAVDRGAIMEAFGKADAGFAVTLAAGNLAMEPVLAAGTDEQKERMCALVLNQGVGAFCLTEPEAGSDISNIKTVAKKEDGYYTIYGRKCFVTNGAHAAFYCVAAKVVEADSDGEKAQEKTAPDGGSMAGEKSGSSKEQGSLSFFFVEAGTSGICVEKHEDKMGIRLSETCDVVFEECRVPASSRIGKEGDGFSIAMRALNKGRIWMSCVAVGLADRALEEGVAYAARREQFGHSVLAMYFFDKNKSSLEDGMRVGIDRTSMDQIRITHRLCQGKNVEMVDVPVVSFEDLIDTGKLDCVVYRALEDASNEKLSHVNRCAIPDMGDLFLDKTRIPVVLVHRENYGIGKLLSKYMTPSCAGKIQAEVLEGKRAARFY